MQAIDLLVEARWVLPIEPAVVLEHHAVAIDGGRIVDIGPAARLTSLYAPAEHISRPGHVLLPGFVNAHVQAATTLLRGVPVRGPLPQWLHETVAPLERCWLSAEFAQLGARLAAAEMLAAGITCFADDYAFPDETLRVARAGHLRAVVGLPIADAASAWAEDVDACFEKAEALWDAWRGDPLVSLQFAPQPWYGLEHATLMRLRQLADQLDAAVTMRLHETQAEVRDSISAHGERPLGRLGEIGLLRPGFTAIHMNWLTDEDIELAAKTGIGAVHCPRGNLRVGSGVSPLEQLRSAGIGVGLGSGNAASAGSLDVLAEARAAALLSSGAGAQGETLSAQAMLRLATLGGAEVLGLAHEIGSLEPGKAADLACIDLATLGIGPCVDAADAVLYGASGTAVSDVWIAGRALKRERQLLAFDIEALRAAAVTWPARATPGAAA